MLRNRKSVALLGLSVLAIGLCIGYWIRSLSPPESILVHWDNVELQDAPLVQTPGTHAPSASRTRVEVEDGEEIESHLFSGVIQIKDGARLVPASRARLYWVSALANGRPPDIPLEEMESVTADDAGRFSTVVASAGGLFCYATHPYGVPVAFGLSRPAEGNSLILEAAAQISVQVLNAGVPARGRFRVSVMPVDPESTDGRQSMTFKGKDGRCLCQGVPAKWKQARVQVLTADERNLSVHRPVRLRFARTEDVVVSYGGLVSLSGRVIDEGHAPVKAAKVYVYRTDPEKAATFRSAETTTDASGRFLLEGLPEGSLRVSVSRSGYASHGFLEEVSGSGRRDLGDIVLTKGILIEGTVDDGRDGGAILSEYRVGIRLLDKQKEPKRFALGPYSGRWRRPTWSDGKNFRFDHVHPGTYRIALIEGALGGIRSTWSSVLVEARSDVKELVLSVPQAVPWRGRIFASGSMLLEGLKVVCRGVQGNWASFGELGAAGRVEIRVRSFPFLLGIEKRSGPLGGLRWIGRIERGVHEVSIPQGGLGFDLPKGGYDAPSYLRIVYLEIPGLGAYEGAWLLGQAAKVKPGLREYRIMGLLPGSYRLDVFWFHHKQSHSFEVQGNRVQTYKWMFR